MAVESPRVMIGEYEGSPRKVSECLVSMGVRKKSARRRQFGRLVTNYADVGDMQGSLLLRTTPNDTKFIASPGRDRVPLLNLRQKCCPLRCWWMETVRTEVKGKTDRSLVLRVLNGFNLRRMGGESKRQPILAHQYLDLTSLSPEKTIDRQSHDI